MGVTYAPAGDETAVESLNIVERSPLTVDHTVVANFARTQQLADTGRTKLINAVIAQFKGQLVNFQYNLSNVRTVVNSNGDVEVDFPLETINGREVAFMTEREIDEALSALTVVVEYRIDSASMADVASVHLVCKLSGEPSVDELRATAGARSKYALDQSFAD